MKKIFKIFTLIMFVGLFAFAVTSCNKKAEDDTPTNDNTNTNVKTGYVISLDDQVNDNNVVATAEYVKVVSGVASKQTIEYGKEYDKNLKITFSVTNNTTDQLRISAYINDSKLKSYLIAANGSGKLNDLELEDDMVLKIEKANDAVATTIYISVDPYSEYSTDGVNAVHAYDPTTKNRFDFADGDQIEIGQTIKAYLWNTATKVRFYVTNGDKIEKSQVYEIMTEEEAAPMTGQGHGDEGKVEFIVEGPVCVTLRIVE